MLHVSFAVVLTVLTLTLTVAHGPAMLSWSRCFELLFETFLVPKLFFNFLFTKIPLELASFDREIEKPLFFCEVETPKSRIFTKIVETCSQGGSGCTFTHHINPPFFYICVPIRPHLKTHLRGRDQTAPPVIEGIS